MESNDDNVEDFSLGVVLSADGVIFKASGKLEKALAPLREMCSEGDADKILKNCNVKIIGKLGN